MTRTSVMMLAAAACAAPREKVPAATPSVSASPVRIDSVRPAPVDLLGPGLAELAIHGQGFTADSNQVLFDQSVVGVVASADGRLIRMRLQRTMAAAPDGGMPQQVTPGDHSLAVRNSRGTSNTVQLKVQSP